jgi:PAS domain S-box-containing protein
MEGPVRAVVVDPGGRRGTLAEGGLGAADRVEVASVVADAAAAAAAVDGPSVDCVVVRHAPPETDAADVLARVRSARPDLATVVAVVPGDADAALAAAPTELLALGPDGTVDPAVAATRLRSAVELAAGRRAGGESRADPRRAFERIDDAVFAVDEGWTVTYANRAGAAVLRTAMEIEDDGADVVGRHLWEEIPAAVDTAFYEHYREAMRTQESVSFESRYEPMDVWFDVTAYPDPDGLSVYFSDVTRRKRRERALSELFDAARSLMTVSSAESVATTVGEAAADVLGYPANAVRLHDREAGLLRPVAVSARTEALMGEREPYPPGEGVTGRAFADGEPVYVPDVCERRTEPAYEALGSAYAHPMGEHGVLTVGTTEPDGIDETDRTLLGILAATGEAALDRIERERETLQLRRVVDHVGGAVFLLDAENRLAFVTAGFAAALGYDRGQLVDRPLDALVADDPAEPAAHEAAIESVRAGETATATATVETGAVAADGDVVPVEFEFSATAGDGGRTEVAGSMTDIRELASTREDLAAERERFRGLFEALPVPVVELVVEGEAAVVAFVNGAFAEVFGYEPDAIRGEALNEFVAPDDEAARALDDRLADGERVATEVQRRTASGRRDFLLRASPYPHGDERRAFAVYTDITDQRERERYLTIVNRVFRHNFRNKLTVITGLAEAVEAALEDDRLATRVGTIREAGAELARLSESARELEALVGERGRDVGTVDAAALLRDAADSVAGPTDAVVALDLPETLPIRAGSRVERAFEELIRNAIEHSEAASPHLRIEAERTADERAVVRFADDGPGIPDDEWAVVTGDVEIGPLRHGTGLGLWLVRWIVDAYGGRLCRVADGDGTTVALAFER